MVARGGHTQLKMAFRLSLVFLVVVSILFSGCASQYGRQMTVVQYYPECYAPIAKLRDEEKQFVSNVTAGAVIGAVAGAAIGGALGGGRGALAGAGAGLLMGAGVAAALTKYKQVQDDQQRRGYLSRDMAAEAATLDRVGLSAALAAKCYREQFDKLLADYNAGGMSKEEFQARSLEIISGLNEIAVITKSFNGEANMRLQQYQAMLQDEAKKDNATLPPMQAVPLQPAEKQQEPVVQKTPPKHGKTSGKSKSSKKRQQAEESAAEGEPKEVLVTQVHGASGSSLRTASASTTPSGPDASSMPTVIAKSGKETGDSLQAASGPDPATLPGVIARRDDYKAKADNLESVQKETVATMETCMSKAEAAGVEIPKSLRPKTTS
ncbi:MAG: hypothetical protein AAGU21_08360 [Solidesulfovibrio sp.]|uniref:hypothetical protein n=1 Tax=Solidesulfovibrio sp. TaxID=2910990 RepID=UPI00315948AC